MRLNNYAYAAGAEPLSERENEFKSQIKEPMSLAEASEQIDIGSVSALAIMEPNNPLRIPEIRIEIGQYFRQDELASCALVCKDWNQTFTRLLYSKIDVWLEFIRRYPPPESAHRHRNLVTSFSLRANNFDPSYTNLTMPNLKFLTLKVINCDLGMTSGFAAMIQRNTSITKLDLMHIKTPDNSLFWDAVSSLPHLEEFITHYQRVYVRGEYTLYENQAKEIQAFWDACSKAKSVTLDNLRIEQDEWELRLSPGDILLTTI
ncbi:hypothetical protein BGX27_003909, partial [Mortierella sp. AM989]